MISRMCRALYSVHSFKPVLDSLRGQPNSQLSAIPQGVIVGSHCYHSSVDSWLMGSSRAILLSAVVLSGDILEFLASTWSGRTNHLEYSTDGWGGQILPFALCTTCIKIKLKLHEFGDRVLVL